MKKRIKYMSLRLSRMPGPLGQVSTMALVGKFERNRGGEAMNRAKSRVLWARISPIQAISLLLWAFIITGTANASYIGGELKQDGPWEVDFFRAASPSTDVGFSISKPKIDFIFPNQFSYREWFGKYDRLYKRWTQEGLPRGYKDYREFDYRQRHIIKRILFDEKGIDIGDHVTIPREGHCIHDATVPIGSSALLLGSGVIGVLLVMARRLRFRD